MANVLPRSFGLDDILPEYTWTLPVVQDAEKIEQALLSELRNGGINETSTCSARIADLSLLQSYLPRYGPEMSRLKHTLNILSAAKRYIDRCFLFHKSSLAPIRRLPVEILGVIFEEACTLPTFGVNSPVTLPTTISSVCFHWRSICLSTPSIWTNITARHTSPDNSNIIARINHYQSMSLNHALTFDLTAMIGKASQRRITSNFRLAPSSFLDRCSNVRLTMTARARVIYNTLIFCSPLLNSVEICALDASTKPWAMFAESPNIQRLHVHGLQGPATLPSLSRHPITTLTLSRCSLSVLWEFVGVTRVMLVDCTEKKPSTANYIPINPSPSLLESLSLTNTLLSPIMKNPSFSSSRLATLEIILTRDSQLPAATLLRDLQYCLVSRSIPPPITSLSLRYVPISDAELINILDRIPLLREISIIEPDRRERPNLLSVITERFMNYLREHPTLESIELVLAAASDKEGVVMDMLERRAILGLLKEVTLGIRHGTEMNAQTLERLRRLREQGIMATQW
ncbi:hypothetical protein IW261DRAFT_1467829 [Armillaria novae-zelandiae]|uniref:F-box domain-containing protein n=1 Tax=Armillaria novae-zelandiae TaxID=153914 RepID=A0AA39PE57_9AGAR|nr:hypothetical protein IW261DRAFT_1467829 [Armillaria novae-zelandiae]